MFRHSVLLVAVLMLAGPAVLGQIVPLCWFEDFDSYDVGSGVHGQGGWEGWDGDPTWDAYVTDVRGHYDTRSVEITGDADLVHTFCGSVFGRWTFTAWQYVPTDFAGESYFILLNTYGGGSNNWSTQVRMDSGLGVVESEYEGAQLPLIVDQWVALRIEIDLDADTQSIYYDDDLLATKSWTAGVSGGGVLDIAAVDLFANGATPIYYDDLTLCFYCPGDFDGDADRDLADLAQLLSNYGMASGACYTDGDADMDGDVDLSDLAALLSVYQTTCD